METVLVLGATSPTAQAFINLMTHDYPTVQLKLFVRNPAKLPANQRDRFPVIVGDAANYADYLRALPDVTYIYNSVGGVHTGAWTQLLLRAIRETQAPIKHVVDISAGGIYGEFRSGLRPYLSAVRTMYPQYTRDQRHKLDWYRDSGLAFTIFRPGLIQDGPETQLITHTPDYHDIRANEFDINRTTFARAAANALFHNAYPNQSLSVHNGAPLTEN